ncbi:hypothetical protein RRG08_021997 [Elysia crispata]|uniref:Uncharacterized protein n=1 Tax=Elysia crispata TaxID=231223 RepID=A0AAE1AAQ9_9GAST|nr:hypothetical protein RRG08_021997 [Elysia crispata]
MTNQDHMVLAELLLLLLCVSCELLVVCGETCRTMTTFNAGLTPRIADYTSRVSRQPAALLAEDSDVICLQEYWWVNYEDSEYISG